MLNTQVLLPDSVKHDPHYFNQSQEETWKMKKYNNKQEPFGSIHKV